MTDMTSMKEWIARLVAFDTTSRNSNLCLIDCIERYFQDFGVETFRIPSADGKKANLLAVVGPSVPGGVVLSGHTDVVPVDGQNWDTDPWALAERDGKLYGRGVCDMKGFCAIGLSFVPEMIRAGLKRPVIFAFSYDEEVGCLGAPSMIREIQDKLPRPAAVIVGEPTSMKVVDGHKGCACFRTTVTGYAAHSGHPNRGVSAVEVAARLIGKIMSMHESNMARAQQDSPFDPPYSSLTVNVMRGGVQTNIMAAESVFDWDVRVIPGETVESFYDAFSAFSQALEADMRKVAPECRISTRQLALIPPLLPISNDPAACLAMALSGRNCTEVVSYAAEAGQFQQAGFPTIICGPGSIEQAHQANEYLSLEQVRMAATFFRRLMARLC